MRTEEKKTVGQKISALLEVVLVRFFVFPLKFGVLVKRIPEFQTWQTESLQMPFPVTGHILMIVITIMVLLITKRDFGSYGLQFKPLKYHLNIAGTCFIPVVLASIPFGLGIDYQTWNGAWIFAIVQVILLIILGRLLQKEPDPEQVGILAVSWIMIASGTIGKALAELVTYGIFVGFGEEIIFRGFIQSRLNDAFGKPHQFYGVKFGWGVVLASILFGLTHVGITTSLITGEVNLTWAWGFWTMFGGLVYGLVREKTGSILAPALLHGLPQAIASAIMVIIP